MGDAYRGSRYYRDESDDERFKSSSTVTRYKVTPSRAGDRFERGERSERIEVDDDRRSRFSGRMSDMLDDRRGQMALDRPRSEYEPHADRPSARSLYYERDVDRDVRREPDRSRVAMYDDRDRRSPRDARYDDEIKVERKFEERVDDDFGREVERYRKETEYFVPADPPPAPVIIRQQAPEPQKIIVQEAPPPTPIVMSRQHPGTVAIREREQDRELVRRERDPYEDEYYYRHERRDLGPYRGDRDYAVSRYERRRRRDEDYSYSDDDDYYCVRRTVVRRAPSESPNRHRRELAEGALAGAGITALVSSRRDEYGEVQENRGRKVLAGAALGALGTEALRRAHSAYEDRWGDGRESPDHHYKLRKGLGIAAVALAAAGAAKYIQTSKVEREEAHRGRSRTRGAGYYSDDNYSRSVSRASRSPRAGGRRHRSLSAAAKAALGTAATAGIVRHLRSMSKSRSRHDSRSRHESRSRSGSRSKSKLRRGAEIAGVAAAAGVANRMWKSHQEKKEARERSASRDYDRDNYRHSRSRGASRSRSWSRSRSRSRSRSMARSPLSAPGADPELGLVEYGRDPLPLDPPSAVERDYDSQADEGRRRRRRRRDRSPSASPADQERKRSRSRLRDMAAAGAAAVGIQEFGNGKDRERRETRSRERGDERRRNEDDEPRHRGYFDEGDAHRSHHTHSPPTASGGAYYPPYPSTPGPAPGGSDYAPYPESSAGGSSREYRPYVPQDYTGYAPPPPALAPPPAPPGPPPAPEPGYGAAYPPTPPGPPPPGPLGTPPAPGGRKPPEHVSDLGLAEDGLIDRDYASSSRGPLSASKSVSFIPLPPKSSRTMERHRREQAAAADKDGSQRREDPGADQREGEDQDEVSVRPSFRRRRSSDPSADRPMIRRRRSPAGSDSDSDDIEMLPDRFDTQGKPLAGLSAGRDRRASRSGTFERRPRKPGDWDVRGAWQVEGTDGSEVDRLVRSMTGALEGRRSWMEVLGEVIGGGLLQGAGAERRRGAPSG